MGYEPCECCGRDDIATEGHTLCGYGVLCSPCLIVMLEGDDAMEDEILAHKLRHTEEVAV